MHHRLSSLHSEGNRISWGWPLEECNRTCSPPCLISTVWWFFLWGSPPKLTIAFWISLSQWIMRRIIIIKALLCAITCMVSACTSRLTSMIPYSNFPCSPVIFGTSIFYPWSLFSKNSTTLGSNIFFWIRILRSTKTMNMLEQNSGPDCKCMQEHKGGTDIRTTIIRGWLQIEDISKLFSNF